MLSGFGLSGDPFSVDHVLKHPELLTRSIGLTLAALSRQAKRGAESRSDLLLVGPEGAGKTTLLRYLERNLVQDSGGSRVTYYDADSGSARSRGEQGEDHVRRPGNLQGALRGVAKGLLLLDNADRLVTGMQKGDILSLKEGSSAGLVLSVSYPTYLSICDDESLAKRFEAHIFVPLHERQEIERMLRITVGSCIVNGDPFDEEAYQEIAAQSMGLPGLAADMANASMLASDWVGMKQVTRAIVDRVAGHLSYKRANKLLSDDILVRGARSRAVNEVLRRFYMEEDSRRDGLATSLGGMAGPTVDYHLQRLAAEGFVTVERAGRRVRYEVPRAMRAALQVKLARETPVSRIPRREPRADSSPIPSGLMAPSR